MLHSVKELLVAHRFRLKHSKTSNPALLRSVLAVDGRMEQLSMLSLCLDRTLDNNASVNTNSAVSMAVAGCVVCGAGTVI